MTRQRTIKQTVRITGVGVHSGRRVNLGLHAAPPNTGIVFERTDLPEAPSLRIAADKVVDTRLATRLAQGTCQVSTVEHLLAALAALGVDNCHITLDAEEVPIMDGSAAPFVMLILDAGIVEQIPAKRLLKVNKKITVRDGEKFASIEPASGWQIGVQLAYEHPVFRDHLKVDMDVSAQNFIRNFARARTYGFMQEVESLRKMGLARGGSFANAVVLDQYRVINSDGLRFPDEMVRHKALDALGDLYICGHAMIGRFEAYMPGHGLNNQLLRELLADASAYEWVTSEDLAEDQRLDFGADYVLNRSDASLS